MNAGNAILLNLLPILSMMVRRSAGDSAIVPNIGAKTMPKNKDPPTHIDAQVRCTQKTKTSANAITKEIDVNTIIRIVLEKILMRF
jgi:hypothetical protein